MNKEKKPIESNDIPQEWQEAIHARRSRRAETIVAERAEHDYMKYARHGLIAAYITAAIMAAVAGAAVGLCAWLVGVAL